MGKDDMRQKHKEKDNDKGIQKQELMYERRESSRENIPVHAYVCVRAQKRHSVCDACASLSSPIPLSKTYIITKRDRRRHTDRQTEN